jgi:hypothetical protein
MSVGYSMLEGALQPKTELVEAVLESVLAGPSFRTSPQSQAFLRYIVEHSVAHHDEMLRERVIGMSVFGRVPDYDTGNDPIVRARAAEVRKRLAQHYQQHDHVREAIRIEIPVGSYRAVFEQWTSQKLAAGAMAGGDVTRQLDSAECETDTRIGAEQASQHPSSPTTSSVGQTTNIRPVGLANLGFRPSNWRVWLGLAAILLLGIAIFPHPNLRARNRPLSESFWAPIINTDRPVMVFIGANHTYNLDRDFIAKYKAQHHIENVGIEFFINLKKGESLDESELVPNNWLIGFGDVAATARIASQLTKLNKSYQIRYGNEITVSDIHSSPGILIGGFSNPWTLELMRKLPIRLESRADGDFIVDAESKTRVWKAVDPAGTFRHDDYAVISRLMNSETGNFDLVIAGIGTYGNEAASNFVSDPDQLSAYLKKLPEGWEQKNMQLVLHISVVKDVPVSTDIETVKVW